MFTYPLKVPGESGNQILTRAGDTIIYKIDETRVIYEISVVLQGMQNANNFALIGAQNNKLHLIRGKMYRFKAGEIRQTEKTAWETTYTWTEDTGTRAPSGFGTGSAYQSILQIPPIEDERTVYLPPAGPNKLLAYGINGFNDPIADYVRSPYHTISFYMNTAMVPQWFQVMGCTVDANGWTTLPGNLNL